MKILITGHTVGSPRSNFATGFFTALYKCGVDPQDLAVIHRLSRTGMEAQAHRAIISWCNHHNSKIAVRNHTPFETSGGKVARFVMHGEVIKPENFSYAILLTHQGHLDEHLENVVYWLQKRSIPYYVVTLGVQNNAEVSVTSVGFSSPASQEGA